ncbi:MAG: InlB B-repeat-containing protein, partial [Raoultibacter sp.]
ALNIPASVTLLGASIVVSSLNLSAITVEEGSKHCAVIDGVIYLLDENGNPSRCIGGSTASVVGTIHLPETTLSIANRAFSGCINMTGAILPEGLISIESCAFQGASIASLNIPSSLVDASESNIYPNCYYLTSVSVAPDNPKYMVIENTVYEKDLLGNPSKIMSGFPSHSGAFTLPETVTEMGLYAFHGCYKITSLTLPASLTSAGRQPISGTNLQEIICYSSRLDPRNSANIESNLNATVYLPEGGTINGISPDQMKAMWQEAGFTNFAVAPKKVVSFESDGGSSVFPLAGDSGFTPIKPADPTKQGYTFAGWYTDATLVNQYTFDTPITINTTLYAKWMPDRTVIFNSNGGTPELSTQVVSHNAVVTQPGNPIREGYTFQGWYTEQTNGTKWNFAAAVTADMTLWARWELNTYTSVFHPNNGGADIRKDVAHGSKVAPPTVSKPGYTFAAWCRDEALTQSFDFDTPVTSNLELWAQWTGLPYTITFDPAEGSGAMAPQAMTYGTKTTLNANAFTRDGYTFTGWNTEKLGTGTAYANKEEVLDIPSNGARDITLYAQWSENTYAIEFVPNPPSGLSAAGTMAAMTNITYNESVILTSNGFACSGGFVFDFWTLDRQGTGTHYANAAEVSRLGSKTQNNETVRLYAQWKGSPYTVSYNKTYADVTGVMSDDTFAYGGWYSLTDNAFVRPGYTFAGWARSEADAQKGVVVYLDGDSVKDLPANTGSSITLYAVWTKQLTVLSPVNPVITIDAQGKPTSDSSTYFESSTEVPVEIVSATCSTVAGPNGTASVFPDTTQWGNIIVTLSSNGTTKNFFLNDSSALLLGFAIPAKTDAANVKLPVTFGMKFLDTVDIEYVKDKQVAVASLVFSFKVA